MTTTTLDFCHAPMAELDGSNSFLVTRQRSDGSRSYERLGVLTRSSDGGWCFRYFRSIAADATVTPLPGLSRRDVPLVSGHLFPVFGERVLSPTRPDRAEVLDSLGLDERAGAFEILSRNGGRRHGDTIELIQLPALDGGEERQVSFLVHGVRYRPEPDQQALAALQAGDRLQLRRDLDNAHDATAHFVTTADGHDVGRVPAPLSSLLDRVSDYRASVAHTNGPTSNPHLRLLVDLRGRFAPAEIFAGAEWELVGWPSARFCRGHGNSPGTSPISVHQALTASGRSSALRAAAVGGQRRAHGVRRAALSTGRGSTPVGPVARVDSRDGPSMHGRLSGEPPHASEESSLFGSPPFPCTSTLRRGCHAHNRFSALRVTGSSLLPRPRSRTCGPTA